MIIAKLQGGMGNQMFQYAMAKALASVKHTSFELDVEFLLDRVPDKGRDFVFRDYDLDIFNVRPTLSKKGIESRYIKNSVFDYLCSGFKNKKVYKESSFDFDPNVFELSGDVYLDGYWQSPFYFQSVEEELRSDFTFKRNVENYSMRVCEKIAASDSVCINVRRADYLNNSFHGVCDMTYFNAAIEYVVSRLSNPHLFVFSDDPAWCRENFNSTIIPFDIIGHEHKGFKFGNYLQLMSKCSHFIIPNSTFGWWAVWLSNKKDSIVVAPQKWFADTTINTNDLIPLEWIRLGN